MSTKPLKVCYFGTYRNEYSRNQIMLAALRTAGVDVVECRVPLWNSIEDRVQVASGGWASLGFVKRVITTYVRLLKMYMNLDKSFDVMVLGYPGQLDVFPARLLSWLGGKPLVLDMFMSIYLIAIERNLHKKSPLGINLLRRLETVACHLPDRLICDTPAYRTWHCETHNLQPEQFRLVPTGADNRFFKSVSEAKPTPAVNGVNGSHAQTGKFRVFYYGTYIPNHGVEVMIEAANCLRNQPDIHFELAGSGPTKEMAQQMAQQYGLTNITFIDWIEKADLPRKISEADLLLGVFGTTPQSKMTVQNKIYEALAMGKPIITGEAETVGQALTHKTHAYLVPRTNPQALAAGIEDLYTQPTLRAKMGQCGQDLFYQKYAIARLGEQFKGHLEELVNHDGRQ